MSQNNLFENKFDVFFKEVPDLTTNDGKNPTLVDLQNLYYTCNQKLNDFEQEYHDRFLDLYKVIRKQDQDLIKTKLNELQSFIKTNEFSINQCYKNIQKKQLAILGSTDDENKRFNKSTINTIQIDTNEKYINYQKQLKILKKYQDLLKKNIEEYNTIETNLNDGILEQTYALNFFIWFIIATILVFFAVINILNVNFGILNNILLLFTVLVSLYFIYSNISIIL